MEASSGKAFETGSYVELIYYQLTALAESINEHGNTIEGQHITRVANLHKMLFEKTQMLFIDQQLRDILSTEYIDGLEDYAKQVGSSIVRPTIILADSKYNTGRRYSKQLYENSTEIILGKGNVASAQPVHYMKWMPSSVTDASMMETTPYEDIVWVYMDRYVVYYDALFLAKQAALAIHDSRMPDLFSFKKDYLVRLGDVDRIAKRMTHVSMAPSFYAFGIFVNLVLTSYLDTSVSKWKKSVQMRKIVPREINKAFGRLDMNINIDNSRWREWKNMTTNDGGINEITALARDAATKTMENF